MKILLAALLPFLVLISVVMGFAWYGLCILFAGLFLVALFLHALWPLVLVVGAIWSAFTFINFVALKWAMRSAMAMAETV